MKKVKVRLQPLVSNINLPTVLKATILPGDTTESLFIATQVGEIFYIQNGIVKTFLDIRHRILRLGSSGGGYDERGLLGLAFHPEFNFNRLFYLHYSVAGTQGPGALSNSETARQDFEPNPCDFKTLNLKWKSREREYDHVDTVEEWIFQSNGQPQKRRTLLNLRRPFLNHNGVNSLNFSPETRRLILTTGDGGSGYDPFNLSQDIMEIAGKIIEIDVYKNVFYNDPQPVTRFNELPTSIQDTLSVMAKGVRNIPGISYQKINNQYIKYVGNVGQDLVESIFSFIHYKQIPVTQLVQSFLMKSDLNQEGLINFGWRSWEGAFPTSTIKGCTFDPTIPLDEKAIVYYDEALTTSVQRQQPLMCYFHKDPRSDKFGGTALTGVQPYLGDSIPELTGSVVFTDIARYEESRRPVRGVLAYTKLETNFKLNDFNVIETDYNFESKSAFFVSLGANLNQTKIYLGVYGSMKVADFNQGAVFEIIPSLQ